MRLQDHVQRLPRRDVVQLASEGSLHVGIRHDAETGVADEHEQQIGDERRFRQRDRTGRMSSRSLPCGRSSSCVTTSGRRVP